MRTFTLLILVFISVFAQQSIAQTISTQVSKEEKAEQKNLRKVKKIIYDYNTNSFHNDSTFKKLRVNDWVSIRILNLPPNFKVGYKVKFSNRNMENADNFGSYVGFPTGDGATGKLNPATEVKPGTTPTDIGVADSANLLEIKNDIEKDERSNKSHSIAPELNPKVESTQSNSVNGEYSRFKINKDKIFKVNENNMDTALLIGHVEHFFNILKSKNLLETDAELKKLADKAIEDYKWQKRLIGYLKSNLTYKIAIRDTAIEELNAQIETLGKLIPNTVSPINHYLPVVQIENFDYTEFLIVLDSANGKRIPITLPYYNKFGFKLDFSTGLVASGIFSPSYKLRELGADSLQIWEEQGKQKFSMGLSLLSHAYFRVGKNFNPAITSGLIVNLSSQNINYALGLSALLGAEQRLVISGGAIAGKVKELPSYLKTGVVYDQTSWETGKEVPLIDKTKLSWWIGISYNIGGNRREKTVEF